jgi:hypothetical protein
VAGQELAWHFQSADGVEQFGNETNLPLIVDFPIKNGDFR